MNLTPTWTARINGAESSSQLLEVVRDFVRSRPREVLAAIRQHCKCEAIAAAEELAGCAALLAGVDGQLVEVSAFFAAATHRFNEVPRTHQAIGPIWFCSRKY